MPASESAQLHVCDGLYPASAAAPRPPRAGIGPCLGAAIVALVSLLPASAAEQDAAIAQCRQVEDALERLACYDRAAPPDDQGAVNQPQMQDETVSKATESAVKPSPRAADAAETAEETPRPGRLRRWFRREGGQSSDEGDDRTRAKDEPSGAITAEVVRVKELMLGNYQLTLDNGEVWRENEYEPYATHAVGDRVTIKPAPMGAHALRNERTRQRVRVRRVR